MNRTPLTAFVFLVMAAVAASAAAGVRYDFQSSTTGISATSLSGSSASDGAKMRVHFVHGDGNVFPDDSVAVTTDGGKSLSVLDLKAKTFYVVAVDQLVSGLGAAGLLKASAVTAKITDAGAGPAIEGLPTRHVLIHIDYDLDLGMPEKTHMTMRGEAWVTDRIPGDTASFLGLKGFHTGLAAVDKAIDTQSAALRGGFPLKEVMNISAQGGMLDFSTTTTATVSNVKVQDIPAAEFVVPAGFSRVESPVERLRRRSS